MEARVIVLLTTLLTGMVGAHDWTMKACPAITPVSNFNVDKFLGLWYVIELFDTSSTCQTLNFTRLSETQLSVTKGRQFQALDVINIDHTNTYTGKLDIPDGDNAAKMRVKWPLNVRGKADYTVYATDYDTYAGIYECQQVSNIIRAVSRHSGALLSRSPTLASSKVKELKDKLKAEGVDISHFDVIDHSVCTSRSDADFNIDVDDSTIGKIITSTGNGLKNVASTLVKLFQVANGASSFADSVVDFTRRFAASTDGNAGADASAPLVDYDNIEIIH